MTQANRCQGSWRRGATVACVLMAAAVSLLAIVASGCGTKDYFTDPQHRPGKARCVYWVWGGVDLEALLEPAAPPPPRWNEFLARAAEHRVLIHDFIYLEGHPEVVDRSWRQNAVPPVTAGQYRAYGDAGRWHPVDEHFAPQATSRFYLRLPKGTTIDNRDAEAWRYPVGTELVQLLYRRTPGAAAAKAQLVEWRRMIRAGNERGQMRSDGTRSDWIFESAIRDPADGLWRRTREDGRDAVWTRLGSPGRRFRWPVVRGHTCAGCHRLAGRSPMDGPRGGDEVYSLGDLREAVWAGQLKALSPWLAERVPDEVAQRLADAPRPPEARRRYELYLKLLARERMQTIDEARAQQTTIDGSPFYRNDERVAVQGSDIYHTQCAACHGRGARGGGPLALRSPAPPALVGLGEQRLLKMLRNGRGTMPAWNTVLPGDEQWRLIEYLRTLK